MDSDKSDIEKWKIKKMIKNLDELKGNGTSLISLIIPPNDDLNKYQKMLTNEYSTASNIKNRVNRLSVLSAITSVQQKLKLYNKTPKNGLIIYCGHISTGKIEKKLSISFEPFKPISNSKYLCGDHFYTNDLKLLLDDDKKYGFIIIDGKETLYAIISGNSKEILYKFNVNLPNKQNKGGQSAPRFGRIREECRLNYISKVCELSIKYFINNNIPIIDGLLIGGLAELKNKLYNSIHFDKRLKDIVINLLDLSYGGNNGLNEAINNSKDILGNIKLIEESNIISEFMNVINTSENKICYGKDNTLFALENGLIDKLILYEDLDLIKYNFIDNEIENYIIGKENDKDEYLINNKNSKLIDEILLSEWIIDNYHNYGTKIYLISDKTQEGNQFCKGFGGIGAILRYDYDFI